MVSYEQTRNPSHSIPLPNATLCNKPKEENAVPEPPKIRTADSRGHPRNQTPTPFTARSATAAFPPAVQSSSNVANLAKLTGFITYASTPAVYACFWSRTLARPVSAIISEWSGGCPGCSAPLVLYSVSISRILRVASKPFMTGIERSMRMMSGVAGGEEESCFWYVVTACRPSEALEMDL